MVRAGVEDRRGGSVLEEVPALSRRVGALQISIIIIIIRMSLDSFHNQPTNKNKRNNNNTHKTKQTNNNNNNNKKRGGGREKTNKN